MNQVSKITIPKTEQNEMAVHNARVESVSGKTIDIHISGVTRTAQRAFSCLIKPEPDDLVLCTKNENGQYYILGIVERPGSQKMTLSFPDTASLVAEEGNLNMYSKQSVTIAAEEKLNCFSSQTIQKSREAVLDFDVVTAKGIDLQANFRTVHLIGEMVNTMAHLVIQKVRNYIRQVEDSDQVKAGHMSRKVDTLYTLNTKNTVMVSKQDTKIDGEHIHMG